MDGLCQCGCGQPAPIATRTVTSRGRIKGRPMRFIRGHNSVGMSRSKPYKTHFVAEDRGYTTPCWTWQLQKTRPNKRGGLGGYGKLTIEGRTLLAHRYYYEQHRGTIPRGKQLDHLCRNRDCVNPEHMEIVTPLENARRGTASKLSDQQARMIYTLAMSGEFSNAEIGRRFKVTRETVRLIKLRGPEIPRRGLSPSKRTA